MFNIQLGAAIFIDVKQRDTGRVVFNQTHLGRYRYYSWHRDMQESSRGFLLFGQVVVQHTQQLQDSFLSAGIAQAGVVNYQIRVDLTVGSTDVQPPGSCVMLLDDVHSWHESRYPNVIVRMFGQQKFSRQFDFRCLLTKVGQETTLLFNKEGFGQLFGFVLQNLDPNFKLVYQIVQLGCARLGEVEIASELALHFLKHRVLNCSLGPSGQ